jgi:hypothetical protein
MVESGMPSKQLHAARPANHSYEDQVSSWPRSGPRLHQDMETVRQSYRRSKTVLTVSPAGRVVEIVLSRGEDVLDELERGEISAEEHQRLSK